MLKIGAEDIRKYVDKRLAHIRKELVDILKGIPEGPLQERVFNLSGEIEKLVYETLANVPKTTDDQKLETGFHFIDHRVNQASYGGVPELFMTTTDQTTHKINYSFAGIDQLFNVEMNVPGEEEHNGGINGHVNNSPSPSPSYEGVGRLFIEGPLKGKKNYKGVTDMFQVDGGRSVTEDGELRKDLGKEFDPTGRNHDRKVSIGGVRQLAEEIEDEEFFVEQNKIGSDDGETQGILVVPEAHNRTASIGGVRQLVTVECETFSDDLKQETSPKVSNDEQKDLGGHERIASVGGVRQLASTVVTEEDLNFDDINVPPEEDQSHNAKDKDFVENPSQDEDLGQHERQVSHGGVRLIQEYDLGLDDLGDSMAGEKPRELFDGQGTVEDPSGHERRRSNLQDGRELFEEMDKGEALDHMRGDSSYLKIVNSNQQTVKIQDLKREHLQLKMSKIELIKSTAEEIDRLRGIVKILANQLRKITNDHNKLLNATFGGQMLDSVSGVFGAVTGFFSAPSEP